jgi:protein-disulfide isomerase
MNTETKFLGIIGIITIVLVITGVILFSHGGNQNTGTQQIADQTILLADTRHTIGDPNASVKIVEFSDFQCPACAAAHPITKRVVEKNIDKVYFVFRHYPLSIHKNSKLAAQASEAADNQDKFWEMFDLLFQNQNKWANSSDASQIFQDYARELSLDLEKFKDDFDKVKGPIEQDFSDGNKVGVDATPTFFINGQKHPGVIQESQFQQIIDNSSK